MQGTLSDVYKVATSLKIQVHRAPFCENYTIDDLFKTKVVYKKRGKKKKKQTFLQTNADAIAHKTEVQLESIISLCEADEKIAYYVTKKQLSVLRLVYYLWDSYGNAGKTIQLMIGKLLEEEKHYLFYNDMLIHKKNKLNLFPNTSRDCIRGFFTQSQYCQFCPNPMPTLICIYCQLRLCQQCAIDLEDETECLLCNAPPSCYVCKLPKQTSIAAYFVGQILSDPLVSAVNETSVVGS